MRKLAILAFIVLAVGSTNCSSPAGAANDIVPSGLVARSAEGAGTLTPNAAGGQGKGKGTFPTVPTFDLVMVVDNNHDGSPNWGDTVTFNVSTTETQVSVACSQNGVVVYAAAWPLQPALLLSSQSWQSGAADCTAQAYEISGTKVSDLGSMSFTVGE